MCISIYPTQSLITPIIMSDNQRYTPIKQAANGHNRVTHRDRPLSSEPRNRSGHLANTPIPRCHTNTDSIIGLTQARWTAEECVTKCPIGEVPDPTFSKSKSKQSTMEVSDALTGLYDDRMTTSVNLTRRMQELNLGEDSDVRFYFAKLDDMCGQLSAMGKDINNEEYTSILLASPPPCYSSIISGITTASAHKTDHPITPELVINLVPHEHN